jgi:hypothetical protein
MLFRSKYGNKKVIESDGTKSDSKLESYLKRQLELHSIPYEQQVKHVLMASFRYEGKAVREIAYKLDFVINKTIAIETKGFFTPDGKIKWKLFLNLYRNSYSECLILRNQKECNAFISRYLEQRSFNKNEL